MLYSTRYLSVTICLTALCAVSLLLCLCPSVHASQIIRGKNLVISTPCLKILYIKSARSVDGAVEVAAPLPPGVRVSTNKDHTIFINQTGCSTLPLTLLTRPDLPLTIEDTGKTAVTLDDRTSTVFLRAGSGPVEMGKAGELGLVSADSGPVTIRTLSDSARIHLEHSAVITINEVKAPAIALYLGGSSSFLAKAGHLQALEITSASTNNAVFHGETQVGIFHIMSAGSIIIDKVSGTLATERDNSGKIIADAGAPPAKNHSDRVTVIPQ